jgi:hypothetical protein
MVLYRVSVDCSCVNEKLSTSTIDHGLILKKLYLFAFNSHGKSKETSLTVVCALCEGFNSLSHLKSNFKILRPKLHHLFFDVYSSALN